MIIRCSARNYLTDTWTIKSKGLVEFKCSVRATHSMRVEHSASFKDYVTDVCSVQTKHSVKAYQSTKSRNLVREGHFAEVGHSIKTKRLAGVGHYYCLGAASEVKVFRKKGSLKALRLTIDIKCYGEVKGFVKEQGFEGFASIKNLVMKKLIAVVED
jgi:hypothetical protein